MPTIPYPNVPQAPGVPNIPREPGGAVQAPTLAKGSSAQGVIPSTWGIFQSGTSGQIPFYEETESGGELSFYAFGLDGASQVCDFPIEAPTSTGSAANFASYNKVYIPTTPIVTLSFSGTNEQKTSFLSTVEQATNTTFLFDIYTPGQVYLGYTIERYSYRRTSRAGATLLLVELCFKQIKQVAPQYTNTPVVSPQSPSAAASVNSGNIQPSVPTSILGSLFGAQAGSVIGGQN